MSDSYFSHERDYSEEYASDSEDFRSTYLQQFQFELEQEESNGNHEKETKNSHASRASAADLSDIRIGKVDWCKCGYCKKRRERTRLSMLKRGGCYIRWKIRRYCRTFAFTWIMKKIINTLSLSFEGTWCEITLLRSSNRRCSVKKGVLTNFTKFTGKRLRPATSLKKSLWPKWFPVNFAKFLKAPILQNTSGRLFLSSIVLNEHTEAEILQNKDK